MKAKSRIFMQLQTLIKFSFTSFGLDCSGGKSASAEGAVLFKNGNSLNLHHVAHSGIHFRSAPRILRHLKEGVLERQRRFARAAAQHGFFDSDIFSFPAGPPDRRRMVCRHTP